MSSNDFFDARERMLVRIAQPRDASGHGLPHWARAEDGNWTLTPDGDWTGGAFVGELWLAHLADPQRFPISDAHAALARMLPRANSGRHSRVLASTTVRRSEASSSRMKWHAALRSPQQRRWANV